MVGKHTHLLLSEVLAASTSIDCIGVSNVTDLITAGALSLVSAVESWLSSGLGPECHLWLVEGSPWY